MCHDKYKEKDTQGKGQDSLSEIQTFHSFDPLFVVRQNFPFMVFFYLTDQTREKGIFSGRFCGG